MINDQNREKSEFFNICQMDFGHFFCPDFDGILHTQNADAIPHKQEPLGHYSNWDVVRTPY